MQQELHTLRQLAEHITQQLQVPKQPWQQQLQQQLSAGSGSTHCQSTGSAAGAGHGTSAGPAQAFLAECQQLRQQLTQLSAAASSTGAPTSCCPGGSTVHQQHQQQPQLSAQRQEQLQQQEHQQSQGDAADLLQELELGDAAAAAVLASDPLQQLRAAVLGLSPGEPARGMPCTAAAAAAGPYGCQPSPGGVWGAAGAWQERLRQAYQQMLRQVQARYQQEQRQSELQHQQPAAPRGSRAPGGRLTEEAGLRQQLARSQQEKQQLQQQARQLQQQVQQELSASAASALAAAQMQHEQQLQAVRQQQEGLVQQTQQDLQALTQQLKEQAAALPSAVAIASMVDQAAARQCTEQEDRYQAALQQREQQHVSLLEELAALRQLHAEQSSSSISSQPEQHLAHAPAHCRQHIRHAFSSSNSSSSSSSSRISTMPSNSSRVNSLATQESGGSSCSSSNKAPATPKQAQQSRLAGQQQQQGDSSGVCLRCGSDDTQSPGRCCFHPGLVPVPGPLMYSPEWHACRAACTPEAPGCYSRREHYYLPSFTTSRPAAVAAAAAGRSRLGVALQSASLSKQHAVQQRDLAQGSRNNVNSTARVAGNGRQMAEQQQQHAAGELRPRSVLPRPITPKSALRASHQAL
ncbi:hypothetical protein COO60DRAFT_1641521 [Scenedesmus sp. NREL 46B-D3]|nr:hypothetical protein COO60DRAFT_1641521 [Scenedesmus sp. NREL 46B-D3]